MASQALTTWRRTGLARLAELESVHTTLTGPGSGRRWGTTQLNRALFIALAAQFQRYARDLHDEAIEVHLSVATAHQRLTLRDLFVQGRRLQRGNPRSSALGSDFDRVGIELVPALRANGPATTQRLEALETLLDFRNAVGHGDDTAVVRLEKSGRIASTKSSYLRYRSALIALANTIDQTVADQLGELLAIGPPW
jgi:hypothetical protein